MDVLATGFYNMDCMEGMKHFPDKYFDLAVVDPPYGGGANRTENDMQELCGGGRTGSISNGHDSAEGLAGIISAAPIHAERTGNGHFRKYRPTGGVFSKADIQHWDIAPDKEYFRELARVSKHQIIWGGNYFHLPPTRCFLVWRKLGITENFSMAMCEYAWTSFNDNAKLFERVPQGNAKEKRFHPTQKPVELYTWILNRYAKPGDKILDTHAGSASCLIAAHRLGMEFVGFEIDEEYYRLAKERLDAEMSQMNIFDL